MANTDLFSIGPWLIKSPSHVFIFAGQWMGRMIEKVNSLEKREKQEVSSRTYTYGELTMIHGEAEAAQFIARGKYKVELDQDGDDVHRKTTHQHVKAMEVKETVSRKRTADWKIKITEMKSV